MIRTNLSYTHIGSLPPLFVTVFRQIVVSGLKKAERYLMFSSKLKIEQILQDLVSVVLLATFVVS